MLTRALSSCVSYRSTPNLQCTREPTRIHVKPRSFVALSTVFVLWSKEKRRAVGSPTFWHHLELQFELHKYNYLCPKTISYCPTGEGKDVSKSALVSQWPVSASNHNHDISYNCNTKSKKFEILHNYEIKSQNGHKS